MMKNKKTLLILRNGKWYNLATNKPFTGIATVNGKTYLYSADGKKIPLTKPAPNISKFVSKLWECENPDNQGFENGRYYYHKTKNGNWDIGPGIDRNKQTDAFNKRAARGFTPSEMNAEVTRRARDAFKKVDEALKAVTQFPDTVSPQIKEGLADIRYQAGPLVSNYPKLLNAVARGDTKGMAEESKVYFWDNNKKAMSFDKKRYETRLKEYFHYKNGGNFLTKKELRELAERFRDNGFV